MECLPAGVTPEELDHRVAERCRANPDEAHDDARNAVARSFGQASWETLQGEVERRTVLDTCDLDRARELIERDPAWATNDMPAGAITVAEPPR